MGINVKARKMLWGRAANRCSFAECRKELTFDETEQDEESVVGDEAHIRSAAPNGPRYDSNYPFEKINEYANLILLCKVHHKVIDDQVHTYSVDKLVEIKLAHERWVRKTLDFDLERQVDEETYLTYLVSMNELLHVDEWDSWSINFMSTDSMIDKRLYDDLEKLNDYLLSRIWLERYPDLEIAFHNFRFILNDFLLVFDMYKTDEKFEGVWYTEKIYKRRYYEEEVYARLHRKFVFHEKLLGDLFCELTRAINYTYELIRKFIFPSYRLKEGNLLLKRDTGLRVGIYALVYTAEEKEDLPYKGLKDFMESRERREFYIGTGVSDDYNW